MQLFPIRPFTWASLQPYSRPAQHAAETVVVGLGNLRVRLSTNCLWRFLFLKKEKLSWRFLKNTVNCLELGIMDLIPVHVSADNTYVQMLPSSTLLSQAQVCTVSGWG